MTNPDYPDLHRMYNTLSYLYARPSYLVTRMDDGSHRCLRSTQGVHQGGQFGSALFDLVETLVRSAVHQAYPGVSFAQVTDDANIIGAPASALAAAALYTTIRADIMGVPDNPAMAKGSAVAERIADLPVGSFFNSAPKIDRAHVIRRRRGDNFSCC